MNSFINKLVHFQNLNVAEEKTQEALAKSIVLSTFNLIFFSIPFFLLEIWKMLNCLKKLLKFTSIFKQFNSSLFRILFKPPHCLTELIDTFGPNEIIFFQNQQKITEKTKKFQTTWRLWFRCNRRSSSTAAATWTTRFSGRICAKVAVAAANRATNFWRQSIATLARCPDFRIGLALPRSAFRFFVYKLCYCHLYQGQRQGIWAAKTTTFSNAITILIIHQ